VCGRENAVCGRLVCFESPSLWRASAGMNAFNRSSGPIRGCLRLEPYMRPPCGIRVDSKPNVARTVQDDLMNGHSLQQMRMLAYPAVELARAGFEARELTAAGYPSLQVAATRVYRAIQLRDAGCSVMDCIGGAALGISDLIQAGYTAREFSEAGIGSPAIDALLPSAISDAPLLASPMGPRAARPYSAQPSGSRNTLHARTRPSSARAR
jgi:hypothetical protein